MEENGGEEEELELGELVTYAAPLASSRSRHCCLSRNRVGSKHWGSDHLLQSWLTDHWLTKSTVPLGMWKPSSSTSAVVTCGMVMGTKLL